MTLGPSIDFSKGIIFSSSNLFPYNPLKLCRTMQVP